ncbi:tetrathionate reductase subunit A, partial [Salmonella enterica subsp. enterica serovar Enteritidis str. 50-5646]
MANLTRRQWLKVGLAVGGMVTFGLSYRDVAKRAIDGLLNGTSGKVTRDRIFGNALIPEAQAQTHWQQNPQQTIAMTQCFGCWTQCGIRARVNADGKVIRIAGNPYHPLSQEHPIDSSVPFSEAMEQLAGESGLDARSTACARGATLLESLYSPLRLLEPMKRVGKRGEGKWQRISFEQLIEEAVEGGDLFGEGHVDGLRAIHAPDTPIDAKHPSFGPKTNQLLVTNTSDEGCDAFLRRFALNSFGSKNFGAHGAYCGLAYRAGSGALMGDLDKNPHVKPDWENVEFALFMGTSPAQSGNPFKRQARQLASARLRENFQYVVVAPALPLSTVLADPRGRWQPVMPGSDSALAMGMIRWIMDNERYNADYLAIPGVQAMQQAGEQSWTNATHLVIADELPTLAGQHLTLRHLTPDGEETPVVLNTDGELVDASTCRQARLFVTQYVTLADGQRVTVKSGLQRLKEAAEKL